DHDDPYDDAHPEGENNVKRQKTSEHGIYMFGESSSGKVNESKPCPSTSAEDCLSWSDIIIIAVLVKKLG
nr:hypothetical protein [Tanacetum cinerariifolium]